MIFFSKQEIWLTLQKLELGLGEHNLKSIDKRASAFKRVHKINFISRIINILSKKISFGFIFRKNMYLKIEKEDLHFVLNFFKKHMNARFTTLIDITCVDHPSKQNRFLMIYNLLSIKHKTRILIAVECNEYSAMPSIVNIFPCANWLEREVWDMFGVFFTNHPDLRRILTDYGFEGFPLRKDFPLMGFIEVRYDDEEKRIVYEPVEMTQQYRVFSSINPWENYINEEIFKNKDKF